MWKLLPVAMLLSIGMLGCTSAQPVDVIGTWTIKNQSREELPPELQKAIAKIVVNADGSFVATELPEELPPIPPDDVKLRMRLDSGTGVWKLAWWNGEQHLQLEFRNLLSAAGSAQSSHGFVFTVSKGWSTIGLFYALGDPDEWRRVEFEKK